MGATPDYNKPLWANPIDTDLDAIRNNFHFLMCQVATGIPILPGWASTVDVSTNSNYARPDGYVLSHSDGRKIYVNLTWSGTLINSITICYDDGVSSGKVCFDSVTQLVPGRFLDEEWVVMSARLSGGVTNKLFYWKSTSTEVTTIATGVMPDKTFLACDGRYIITPATAGAYSPVTPIHMSFLGWDGATGFTEVGVFNAGDTVNAGAGLHTSPELAGRILVPYTDPDSVSVLTYDPLAPVSLTQTSEYATGSTLKGGPYDLRSGIEKFTPTHGTTRFIGGTAFDGNDTAKMFNLTGNTLITIATGPTNTSQFTGFFPQRAGYDRDYHIAYYNAPLGQIYAWVMDVDTPSIGARLTLTGGGTPAAITGVNGFVIIAETDGLIKSYSRAGTVLTEVSSYDSGAPMSANGQLVVSPYTNWVYPHYTAQTGTRRVLKVSESGIITALGQMPQMTNTSGLHSGNWSFISSALPDLS